MDSFSVLDYLANHGIKPSQQRIAVMDYLINHRIHPSVEEIYAALHNDYPTLSKTTVYNTLRILVENGAAQMLTIDERHVCYDAEIENHAHLLCKQCGKVIDIPLPATGNMGNIHFPKGAVIDNMYLFYRGLCPECATKQEK